MASPQFINMLSLGDIYFTDGKGNFRFQWSTSALYDNKLINPDPALFLEDGGEIDDDYFVLKSRYNQVSAHQNDGSNNAANFICRVYDRATNAVVREAAVNGTSVEFNLPDGEFLWDVTAVDGAGNEITRSEKNYICTYPAAWENDSMKISAKDSSSTHLIGEVGGVYADAEFNGQMYSARLALAGRIKNINDQTESNFIVSGPEIGEEKAWNAAQAEGYAYSVSNACGTLSGDFVISGDLLLTDAGLYVYENGQWNYKFFVQPWLWGSESFDDASVLFCDGGGLYGKTVFRWNPEAGTLEEMITAKKQIYMISGKYHVTEDGVFSNTTGKKILSYKIADGEGEHRIYNDLFLNSYLKDGSGKKCDKISAGQPYSIEARIVLFNADGSVRKNETVQLDAGTAPYDLDSEELFGEKIGNCITFALSQETPYLNDLLNDPNLPNKAFVVAVGQDGSFTVRSQDIVNRPYFYVDNNGALVCKYSQQDPQTWERSSFTNVMCDQVNFAPLSDSSDPVIVPGVVAGVDVNGNVYTFHGDNQSATLSSPLAVSGKYVLNGNFGDMNGSVTLLNGGARVATGSIKNGVLTFNKNKPVLLNSAADVTLQVTAKKASSDMTYSAVLQPESDTSLFNQVDTVGNTFETAANLGSLTGAGPVAQEWVGFGDEFDVYAFSLDTAAKLSLDLTSTDAARFTIYDSNGKSIQSSSLKANAAVTTKAKLLNPGNYFLAVQSTNAVKGGAASYTVGVAAGTEFFGNIFTSPLAVGYEQKAGKTDVTFSWNTPENAGSRKITYFVSIDGGQEKKVSKTSFTAKKLSMTDHTARIYAKDNYGNVSGVTEVNFTIADTTAPKVSGLTASVTDDTAVVKFKATDNIGVTGYQVMMDNIENHFTAEDYNNAGGLRFDGLDHGEHTVSVRAVDAAGNISTAATKKFTVKYEKNTTYIVNGSASIIDGTAAEITLSSSVSAQKSKFFTYTSQNNPDFLHFWVDDGTKMSSAVQMDVYRQTGTDANGSFADKIDHETFPASGKNREYTLVAEPNRTYFIEFSAGSPVDFSINGSVSELKLDKSSFETAEEITSEFFDGCLASINRQDYYRFSLWGAASIQLFADSFSKTNWELYDSGMNLLRGVTVESFADFSIDLPAGDYYLKVALPDSWKYDVGDAVCTYSGFFTVG